MATPEPNTAASSPSPGSLLPRAGIYLCAFVVGCSSAGVAGALTLRGILLPLAIVGLACLAIFALAIAATRRWPEHWWRWGIPGAVPYFAALPVVIYLFISPIQVTSSRASQLHMILESLIAVGIVFGAGGAMFGAGLLGGNIGREWSDPSAAAPNSWQRWGPIAVYGMTIAISSASIAIVSGIFWRGEIVPPLIAGGVFTCALAVAATPAWPRHRHTWGIASVLPFLIFFMLAGISRNQLIPDDIGERLGLAAMFGGPFYVATQFGGWIGLVRKRRRTGLH